MTSVQVAQRMSAEEFLVLREQQHDARILELVEGELVVHHPTIWHGDLQRELLYALETWVREKPARGRLAWPLDIRLGGLNFFVPDLLWYRDGRAPARHDPPPYPLPDIAIEIRSPSTWSYDIGAKKAAYERHGLPELWLVDTVAEAVLVFRRSATRAASFDVALELGRSDSLTSPLLPGFALALAELFPEE